MELPSKGLMLIYGEGGAGKTFLALSIAKKHVRRGDSCLYIYAGRPSVSWIRGIYEEGGEIALIKLSSFEEQRYLVRRLHGCRGAGHRLMIFDPFTELYRVFIAKSSNPIKAGKMLGQQLAMLSDLAESGLLIVLTSRARRLAYDLEPEASSLLEYWCNLILRLERLEKPRWRRLIVEKAPQGLEGAVLEFQIGEEPWKF